MTNSALRGRFRTLAPAVLASSALIGGLASASPAMADTAPVEPTAPPQCEPGATGDGSEVSATGIDDGAHQGMVELRLDGEDPVLIAPADREDGQRFGADAVGKSMAESGHAFILVGAPGETVNGEQAAGALYVYLNTADGICQLDHLTQDDERVPGQAEADARFGLSVDATSGSDDTYRHYVHAGAPGLTDNGVSGAGGVVTMELESAQTGQELVIGDGDLTMLSTTGAEPTPGAHFGAEVVEEAGSESWYTGAPGATVDGAQAAGLVAGKMNFDDEDYEVFSQATEQMQGTPEPGDRFGSALDDSTPEPGQVWIGIPGEDVGDVVDAGMVSSIRQVDDEPWSPWAPGPSYTQNTPDDGTGEPVPGTAEEGDRFGAALGTVPVTDHDLDSSGILVGTPGEDALGLDDVGTVTGLHGAPSFSQADVGDEVGAGNQFGAAVGRLSVGAPGTAGDSADGGMAAATPNDGNLDWTYHSPSADLDEDAAYGTTVNLFEMS